MKIKIEILPEALSTMLEALNDYIEANAERVHYAEQEKDDASAAFYADAARAGVDLKRIVMEANEAAIAREAIRLEIARNIQGLDEELQDSNTTMSKPDRIDYAFGCIIWQKYPKAKLDTHAQRIAFV